MRRTQKDALRAIHPDELRALGYHDPLIEKQKDVAAKKRRQNREAPPELSEEGMEKKDFGSDRRNLPSQNKDLTKKDFEFVEKARERKIVDMYEKLTPAFRLMPINERKAVAKEAAWLKNIISDAATTRPEWPTWEVLKRIVQPLIDKRILEESFRLDGKLRRTQEERDGLQGLEMLAHFISSTVPQTEELPESLREKPPMPVILGLPEDEDVAPEEETEQEKAA